MLQGLYRTATRLAAPLIHRHLARRAGRGKEDRARIGERLGRPGRPRPDGPLLWVHGASVGESLSALPLIEAVLAERPQLSALVTTGTVTSAALMARRLPERAFHQFVPIDVPGAVERFLDHWRPNLGLVVESELWPNLLAAAGRHMPLVLVNGRMSERSFRRWRRVPATARALLSSFAFCLAQSEDDARRLRTLGAREVLTPGNLKYAAAPLEADPTELATLREHLKARAVWVAASTHPGEEEQVADAHAALADRGLPVLTILIPRHPERGAAIAAMIEARGLQVARRSAADLPTGATAVYLVDTLGELGLCYRLGACAFIGGSLVRHGGQNPLEPARLGCPPLFGPHTWNFADATRRLLDAGAAERVTGAADLANAVARLLTDADLRRDRADAARGACAREAAVLPATLEALAPLLDRLDHARARVLAG